MEDKYISIKLQLNIILSIISAVVLFFLIFIIIEDFSLLFSPYYQVSEVLKSFFFNVFVPGIIFSLTLLYSSKKIIKFAKSENLKDYQFKKILPKISIIIAILGSLFLGIVLLSEYITNPTNTEAGIAVAMMFMIFGPIFIIITIVLWFIGSLIDKHNNKC
ncbi:hypothetical protein J4226_02115 [Candidatus Pacearchaeota archaeon]|nr:hypothetical protein [Candidatus Pacearchaeota archaeon]